LFLNIVNWFGPYGLRKKKKKKTLLEAQMFDPKNFLLTIIATPLEHI
jgi:hypothetical protein